MEELPLDQEFLSGYKQLLSDAIADCFLTGAQHGLEVSRMILNNEEVTKEKVMELSEKKMKPLMDKYLGGK
jgi:hypothetical protein